MKRKTSPAGIALLKSFERLVLMAYPDPCSALGEALQRAKIAAIDYRRLDGWQKLSGDPWTLGYGFTRGVKQGQVISAMLAEARLILELREYELAVNRLVTVELSQNQFDALVLFAYNVGTDEDQDAIPEGLGDSTLLKKLNAGDVTGAADEFLVWNKSKGKVVQGLVNRRRAERALFLRQ